MFSANVQMMLLSPRRPMFPSSPYPPTTPRVGSFSPAASPAKGKSPPDLSVLISNGLSDIAVRIRAASVRRWNEDKAVELIGLDPRFTAMLAKVEKFARFQEPILITGESGVGKELLAKACYLLSARVKHPFVSVNCPQFQDSNTTVSELFGHVRGSFTGAQGDHKGLFETADHGVLFLDEIGDLTLSTQVLLLRALAEGEFKALGCSETRKFNARFITATNQQLAQRMNAKEFREDLFFRLRYFRLEVPPLRDRGDDWRLLLDVCLARLNTQHGTRKHFSQDALEALAVYRWPGNVRELRGIVSMAYSLGEGNVIALSDFQSELRPEALPAKPDAAPSENPGSSAAGVKVNADANAETIYHQLVGGQIRFWEDVCAQFMEREMNREQMKAVIARGLQESHGNYRRLQQLLRAEQGSYQKFMDFLRHHRLKP